MSRIITDNLDYSRPIKLAEDVYWVGFGDALEQLYCNPYLIVDGEEAVLIDGGSRPDFSTVMRKVLQTGISPDSISHLIYHHYDPDLCGSIPNLEDIIDRDDLKLVSKKENNTFIRYYSVRSELICIDDIYHQLTLQSGRVLRFIPTPYAHSAGSFMTYDEKTGILFTSDLFGSIGEKKELDEPWDLFLEFGERCRACENPYPYYKDPDCTQDKAICPWVGICRFNQRNIPSNSALQYALERITEITPKIIAPQHGSILYRHEDIEFITNLLMSLDDVGIDGILKGVLDG